MMPLRRTSASPSPASFTSPTPSTRRRNGTPVPASSSGQIGEADQWSLVEASTGQREISGQHRVVVALVGRLVNKLPCNSGTRLSMMEADPNVMQTVESLLKATRMMPGIVFEAIAGALETLAKYSNSSTAHDLPLDTLHSQIYLFHILNLCMLTWWRSHAQAHAPPLADVPRAWPDPSKLDDHLARYLLNITVLYVRLVSSDQSPPGPGKSSPAPSRESRTYGTVSSVSLSTASNSESSRLGHRFIQQASFPSSSTSLSPPPSPDPPVWPHCGGTLASIRHLTLLIGRVVFCLSAANWPSLLATIKARLSRLTTTIDDNPDVMELRLLEWSNINKQRLSQTLQEVSSIFLNIKRPSQIAVATVLRRAIWNFIEVHPLEYQQVIEVERRIEGGVEQLFENLQSASDITSSSQMKRTRAFYPLMASLMVLSPTLTSTMVKHGPTAGKSSKKLNFYEGLFKYISTSKGHEACAVCLGDFVSAGMVLPPSSPDTTVRLLMAESHEELKNALFYSPMIGEISDHSILVDSLVALYRVKPSSVTALLFGKLFADSNEVNRIVAVKACREIVLQDGRLPWHPASADLRDKVAAAIRSVFKVQVNMLIGDYTTPRRPQRSPELLVPQTDLIIEVLRLFALDPVFAFTAVTEDASDSLANLLLAVSSLMVAPAPDQIRATAAYTSAALISAMTACMEDTVAGSGTALWQILLDVGRQGLFAIHSDRDDIDQSFNAFRSVSVSLGRFADRHPDILATSPRGEAATLLSVVAMISALVSPDFEQLSQSKPCLEALAKLTLVAHRMYLPGHSPAGTNFGNPEVRILMRCKAFTDLAKLPPATGRHHQQRAFRKVYKTFGVPTTGGVTTWLGIASVAKSLNAKIDSSDGIHSRESRRRGLAPDIDGLDEGEAKTWQNITLFLAATAATCRYEDVPPPPITHYVGKGILPTVYDDLPDPTRTAESFIRTCVDLLISGSLHVRETVKEALGVELPSVMMGVMVGHMTRILSHSLSPAGVTVSDTFSSFVDQVLAILRLSLDRLATEDSPIVMPIDLGEITTLLLQYVGRLGKDETSLRLRIRFCQFCELVFKSDRVTVGQSMTVKNDTMDSLTEWSIEAMREVSLARSADGHSKLYKDLDIHCLRAMVPVSNRLSLRARGDELDTTAATVKSRLFHRIYSHLVKLSERSNSFSDDRGSSRSPSVNRPSSGREQTHATVIAIISNLLSANVDVGLKHCLCLGYHEDPMLRTVFMQVLGSVLGQGAKFGGFSSNSSAAPKAYTEILAGIPNNFAMAVALCEVCTPGEIDEMSMLLFRVFESKGTVLSLVKLLAEREIALTNHESDLFRANSITTRLLTIFAKTYGYNYVRATLQPLIHSLVEKPAECSFELDPLKAGPMDDIERNADHLQLMCQALLDLICSSVGRAPVMFRAFCNHLWEVIEDRFPESRMSVIGSFIFLRFFCPSIVAPENIDLDISPNTREVRRALLLITKVIQNLANNVTFGNKEPHMKVLNGFLSENIRQVTKFLSDLAIKPKPWEIAAVTKIYQEDADRVNDPDGDETLLQRFVHRHLAKIEACLDSLPSTYRSAPNGSKASEIDLDGRNAARDLKRLVERTGPPSDITGLSPSARAMAYDEFMARNRGRAVDAVTPAFYEGPMSQNGRRIFYFVVSKVGLLDYDLLAYHVFTLLDDITDFFDLVIDLTEFSSATELPLTWLKRSIQMCPPGILPCINVLALYNPNAYARRRIRRIVSELAAVAPSVGKTIVAASSPAELAEFIPFTSLSLPEYTMALAYEAEHVFTNLLCLSDHEQQVPVVVKLGHECMQVASWRKQDLTPNVKSYIIDVIKLSDIDDILTGANLPSDHLVIKYCQNESVTFVSRKRGEMAQIIRKARSRLQDAPSDDRTVRPSDVPGMLMNIGLFNLSASDERLRRCSLNLLIELSRFFKFDINPPLPDPNSRQAIPANSDELVDRLTRTFASSAPHLTIEFLKEWTNGYSRAEEFRKGAYLFFVGPWLANLDAFAKPSREDGSRKIDGLQDVIKSLVNITMAERRRNSHGLQSQVWCKLSSSHEMLVELVLEEVLSAAADAGLGSDKAEAAADILVAVNNRMVRGRVIARLRKTIAQTYLKPSASLPDSIAWAQISTLTRIVLMVTFAATSSPIDIQLFLPELIHVITLLMACGPLTMRRTVYQLALNVVRCLATETTGGEMDLTALRGLQTRLLEHNTLLNFGLMVDEETDEVEVYSYLDEKIVDMVEAVTQIMGDVLTAGAVHIDCANAWRARWMGLVSATCFQHNPATQPQAFTVLGYLARDEVDDDSVYQILVAMSMTLSHFSEVDNVVLISMLKCLGRIIPGLALDSRYATSLFWLAVGILQLGYIPPFTAALELLLISLEAITNGGRHVIEAIAEGRDIMSHDALRKLEQIAGMSFDTNVSFSLAGVISKGARHPSTRNKATDALLTILRMTSGALRGTKRATVNEDSVAFFMALLPTMAGSPEDLAILWAAAGLEWDQGDIAGMNVLELLSLPDNSAALLVVTLVVSMLGTASSEHERVVIYRFLANAALEIPEVVSLSYDTIIPRMTAVIKTTSNPVIIASCYQVLEVAMSDPEYTFPPASSFAPDTAIGTTTSLSQQFQLNHQKSYSGSISSNGVTVIPGVSQARDQVLEDLGMRGLGDLSFSGARIERVAPLMRWVAALIDSFTM